jgi:hypothetical protein
LLGVAFAGEHVVLKGHVVNVCALKHGAETRNKPRVADRKIELLEKGGKKYVRKR